MARITVPQAAERRNVEAAGAWIPWRNDVAPYMVEPMEVVTSRRFEAVGFVGPARCSKTEALILNPLTHMVLAAPRLMHVVHMTQAAAREFSIETVDKLLRHSPELAARLDKGKGADNTYDKRFVAGGRLTIGWPVVHQLSARSIPIVVFTDYDRMPQDIGGEGSPFALGRKRTQSAGTRGMTVAEASPGFPIMDESFEAATPHEAPPCDGILGIYNTGTRARWYWGCPSCGEAFEPDLKRLHWPKDGTPTERGRAAVMVCPHNGCVIQPAQKAELNRRGFWLHEAADGTLVRLGDDVRPTAVASYWLKGAAAAFASWAQIVTRLIEGEERFEATGDESLLKTAMNVDHGLPYLPRALGASALLSEAGLKNRATDRAFGVCPEGTRFVTVAVDVQAGRFVVQVEAWTAELERTMVDRFDIATPPESAPRAGKRAIDPARYSEDWDALFDLAGKSWPVAGSGHRLRACGIIFDAGGAAGVTPNAYAFFRKARRRMRGLFHLVRGRGGDKVKRAERAYPETAHKGKKHVAKDIPIIWAGTDRLKDEVAASLTRGDDGARALHIPKGAPPEVFAEYAAERRTEKGWEKKPGCQRNEALDLSVYSLALALIFGVERMNWDRPERWARLGAVNAFAVVDEGAGDALTPEVAAPDTSEAPDPEKPKASRRRPRRAGRRGPNLSGW
ncbi:MAG: terminase gpA endonuclease subunit [Pseudomonadota bacterium]